MKTVQFCVTVNVYDEERLREYCQEKLEDWGFGDWEELDLDEMIYEALILNVPPGGPDGVGLEIQDHFTVYCDEPDAGGIHE